MSDSANDRRNVKVSQEAFAVLESLTTKHGVKQYVIAERLLKWIGEQPDDVQEQFVLANGDPAAALLRRKLADDQAIEPGSVSQILASARTAIDKLEHLARAGEAQIAKNAKEQKSKLDSRRG